MENIYWTTNSGKKILVDDMSVDHLRNTLKMIIRKSKPVLKLPKFTLNGDMANQFNDVNELAELEDQLDIE